jgi:cyclopropane fatty-acyl-phospholipid synthase-like methyltransferase
VVLLIKVARRRSGPGTLSYALLDCFPQASVVALDGSASMRAHAQERLSDFGSRFSIHAFELEASDWISHLDSVDSVVSSLCLHHLSGKDKRRLFSSIFQRISPRGALVIADLVEPQLPQARELFASGWDRSVEEQSNAKAGSTELFDRFVSEKWNYYRFPDPIDRPSALIDQLTWLKEAGFAVADCFWLRGGHAIFGGFKYRPEIDPPLKLSEALRSAEKASRNTI